MKMIGEQRTVDVLLTKIKENLALSQVFLFHLQTFSLTAVFHPLKLIQNTNDTKYQKRR